VQKLGSTYWDLAPDGRIAVVTTPLDQPAGEKPPADHTVLFLQHFFDDVRRRVK
jgi:hypothetical protein